ATRPSLPLFFERSPVHPDLHSFPTRRSSDLTLASARAARARSPSCGARWRQRARSRSKAPSRKCPEPQAGSIMRNPSRPNSSIRSEEHTSELQSRENLVCRLLLEKKKNEQKE